MYRPHHHIVFLCSALQLLVTANFVPSSPIPVTLMMEAIRSSKTSVLTRHGLASQTTAFFKFLQLKIQPVSRNFVSIKYRNFCRTPFKYVCYSSHEVRGFPSLIRTWNNQESKFPYEGGGGGIRIYRSFLTMEGEALVPYYQTMRSEVP
jgi:hypothetical protein